MKSKKTNAKLTIDTKQNRLSESLKFTTDKWAWFILSAILFTTILIYLKVLKFDLLFTWDDCAYITENNDIKDLKWGNIQSFFTKFYVWNYHPLTMITYALEYKIMGNSASFFHFNNLLIHIANTILVFIFIRKISAQDNTIALITAAFFAVHPMHVESVAWISERKDVLYSFFFLLSLIAYINYIRNQKLKFLIFSGIFFMFSCLSKSASVITPLVMMLIDYYLNRKWDWKIVFEKIPFLIISLIFGIVAIYSQKTALRPETAISFTNHLFVVIDSFVTYILKAFVPIHQSAIYPYPNLNLSLPFSYYLSGIFLGLIISAVWYSRRWGKDIIFGFGFFILTIVLVLQIVSVGNATMADRYTYIPYIGLFFIGGKLYSYISTKTNLVYKNLSLLVFIIGFISFISISSGRISVWKSDLTLFGNVLDQYPDCSIAYFNRAAYYLDSPVTATDSVKRTLNINNAIKDYTRVIDLNKHYRRIYSGRAKAEYLAKDYLAAVKDYNSALSEDPGNVKCYFPRGVSNYMIKDYVAAINDFSKTLQADSTNKEVYLNRALAYYMSKDYTAAVHDLSQYISLNPNAADGYFNRANAEMQLQNYDSSLKDYDKAIILDPSYLEAYQNRSILKFKLQDYTGTILDYDQIIELNPGDSLTVKNRLIIKSFLANLKTR